MYYLLVCAQLTAVTPLLFRLLRRCCAALYAVAPCVIAGWELLAPLRVDVPSVAVLFPTWLVYYLFGLEWGRWRGFLRDHRDAVAIAAALALFAQSAEGFLWHTYGDYNMATTQLRLTNVVSSLAVIALLVTASGRARGRLSSCGALVLLGDLSFGVYLCHMAILAALGRVLGLAGLEGLASSFVLWFGVIVGSVLLVSACRKVLPRRVLGLVGLE